MCKRFKRLFLRIISKFFHESLNIYFKLLTTERQWDNYQWDSRDSDVDVQYYYITKELLI